MMGTASVGSLIIRKGRASLDVEIKAASVGGLVTHHVRGTYRVRMVAEKYGKDGLKTKWQSHLKSAKNIPIKE